MKRTVPLLITACAGFALIVADFVPYTQSWGEKVAIWFDILAAIAFVLFIVILIATLIQFRLQKERI